MPFNDSAKWVKLYAFFKKIFLKIYLFLVVLVKPFTTDWDSNLCAGARTQPKPCLGLKPSQNPAWDSNPHGWDEKFALVNFYRLGNFIC